MNEYDLFDAFGGVDEDLLERSERRPVRRLPLRKALIAAAAVMALAVTVFAAPLIAELLFHTDYEKTFVGFVSENADGKIVVYADTYRIDFTLENPDAVPVHFESFNIPTYFEQNGWYQDYGYDLTENRRYPCMEYMWLPSKYSNSWCIFSQSVFVQPPYDASAPLGTGQFFLPIPPDYELFEETLLILDREITSYRVDYDANFGERYLFWTDGQYAYQLNTTTDITEDVIGKIIESIESVNDNSSYLKTGTHMIPAQLIPSCIP